MIRLLVAGAAAVVVLGGVAAAAVPALAFTVQQGEAEQAEATRDTTCGPTVVAAGGPSLAGEGAALAAAAVLTHGDPSWDPVEATAVILAESGGKPTITNRNNNGSVDYGLWQINSIHRGLLAANDWRDPAGNTRMAVAIYREAGGWTPWVAWKTGKHRQYLGAAGLAVAAATGSTTAAPVVAAPAAVDCEKPAPASNQSTAAVACTVGGEGQVEAAPGGVQIRVCAVGPFVVDTLIAADVAAMLAAARADGVQLGGSAYRSNQRQKELYAQNCRGGRCSPPTAKPGLSRHEWARALDITCSGTLIRSRRSPCFTWLASNAATYGLKNLPSEPWHWSDNGN